MKILLLFALMLSLSVHASYKVALIKSSLGTKIKSVKKSTVVIPNGQRILLRSLPRILDEGPRSSKDLYQEYIVDDSALSPELKSLSTLSFFDKAIPGAELRNLVLQGPTANRINLTIVGDGYTLGEKEKFFADAMRTTKELFTGHTFASYLPLFNVFAVFVPSNTSGIGDGEPKDTALKLYRSPKGSKRAIIPGNAGAADAAIALAPATDFPILLANDNYYGGLGGEFAVSTSSVRSGMIVLRHELGHNFGSVGEEYDGGYVYAGANFSSSRDAHWSYWADSGYHANEVLNLGGEYMWQNLAGHSVKMNFTFPAPGPAGVPLFSASISSVGWETPNDVEIAIDGKPIRLQGDFHDDRNFYDLGPTNQLPQGIHVLTASENIHDGDNVLAYVRLYAHAPDYDFTPDRVGAYAVFNDSGLKMGYRPTHNSCLMRNMQTPNFCVVDKENMWLRFLDRIDLIDGVNFGADRNVWLRAPSLNGLNINWYKLENGRETELTEFRNRVQWKAPDNFSGMFKVRVFFSTPEVRKTSSRFKAEKDFTI